MHFKSTTITTVLFMLDVMFDVSCLMCHAISTSLIQLIYFKALRFLCQVQEYQKQKICQNTNYNHSGICNAHMQSNFHVDKNIECNAALCPMI